ncbi:MAG: IS91 family transposase, partial [Planctomycetes bacterium]|nr:IS91 family transposase [Planctomycetota bacterium]
MTVPRGSRTPHRPVAAADAWRPRRPEATVLYRTVAGHLADFLAAAEPADGRPGLPGFVRREFRAYLECGILARGFLRVRCGACREDVLVAFSCKGRGICPSCGGRRMADAAAHLVDRVLPPVAVRQWVLTLPFRLRFVLAFDRELCRAVRAVFLDTLLGALRRRARAQGVADGRGG